MKIQITSPTKAFINATQEELDDLSKELTYTNTAIQHDVKRLYNNHWFRNKNPEVWQKTIDDLKKKIKQTLVFYENGKAYIRPGSVPYLENIKNIQVENKIIYPPFKKVAWNKPLTFNLHGYQEKSVEKLMNVKHGNVEITTGAGKSAIILKLCRETGLKTAIIAPSKSIFEELLEKFEHHLGRDKVGYYGNGKKKLGKLFTICIGDSVVNIEKDTEEWKFFNNLDMLIVDESHTWGSETLENICHNILDRVPYRFFMSATQTRGDGAEKLLQSIIGSTVCNLSTEDAVKGGYICPHDYTIIRVESSDPNYNSSDVLAMKRGHFLKNRNIAAIIAKLANSAAVLSGKQTLVLVEELPQIAMLKNLLTVPFAYAHSDSNKKCLQEIGLEKVDTKEAVEKFNKNEVKVLIGTSCIATGTNIFPTHQVVNWVGGASEIKTKQGAVGRAVRLHQHNPYKDKCVEKRIAKIFDFDVYDIDVMRRHLAERLSYYLESGAEIRRISLDAKTKKAGDI